MQALNGTCPICPTSSLESLTGHRAHASWPQSGCRISFSANELSPTHEMSQSYYNVTGLLGEGSHGKVLLARSRGHPHGLAYAIKVLRRKVETQRELEILQWIAGRPSGVCFLQKMIKGFERGDHLFIVMVRSQPTDSSIVYSMSTSGPSLRVTGRRHDCTASQSVDFCFSALVDWLIRVCLSASGILASK